MTFPDRSIIFRADGHARMGLGHLYRSAALAAMLKPYFRCRLVYHHAPRRALMAIAANFYDSVALEDDGPDALLRRITPGENAFLPIIVLDGYHFRTDYQRAIVDAGHKLVCIDDIHDCEFLADLIINHAPVTGLETKYRHARHTALAFGTAFALLRRPFLEAARAPMTEVAGGGFYVCFGGSDGNNVSGQLIGWLTALGYTNPIDVVLGGANRFGDQVAAAAEAYPGEVTVHHNLDDAAMIALYRRSRLAFLPASTTLLEAIATGAPVVTGHYVDNQIDIYHGFMALGFVRGIADWNAPTALGAAIEAALLTSVEEYRRKARSVIDGYSDVSLRLLFEQLATGEEPLTCRPAGPGEMRQYFEWVNAPAVRQTAIRQDLIAWADHVGWYTRRLADPDSLLLFYTFRGRPCGQLRYELAEGEAVVSISIDKTFRGKGLGSRLLRLGERQLRARHPTLKTLVAYVRPDNLPSVKIFERDGFTFVRREILHGTVLLRLEKLIDAPQ